MNTDKTNQKSVSTTLAPSPKELLLARIRHASVMELHELVGRELEDTAGLTVSERFELEHAIEERDAVLHADGDGWRGMGGGAAELAHRNGEEGNIQQPTFNAEHPMADKNESSVTRVFHVERMGEFGGHFSTLGLALQRVDKTVSDIAHAQALAEELVQMLQVRQLELMAGADGVIRKN